MKANKMGKFVFNTPAGIRFGVDVLIDSVEEIIRVLGPRILVVSDPELSRISLYQPLVENLIKRGIEVKIFDQVEQDPTLRNLEMAIETGVGFLATGVLGFGGGSPMDVAKLTALFLSSGENIESIWGVNKIKGPRLPLILVPTTAGTGSEVTPVSIITVENREKRGASSQVLIPDLAILDPSLTMKLPPGITASTGIDAMVHAIEAYTSNNNNNNVISSNLAIMALDLLGSSIISVVKEGNSDQSGRYNMLLGSMLAGQSFANSPVAAVHALAYPLGGKYKVSHGLSNALLLPHVMRFNMQELETKQAYAKLAGIAFPALNEIKNTNERAELFATEFIVLSKKLGLPTRMRDINIPKEACREMSVEAMKQQRLLVNNPKTVTQKDAEKIYELAW